MPLLSETIDIVITWVDGNDPVWREECNRYAALEHREIDNGNSKYRDWGTLRFLFRGIEKYTPWVNKVFFITCGHLPEWLDTSNPRSKIVRHEDIIPAAYLPTFNSNVIEFYFHRIEGLSDRFVYFNDDMLLLDKVTPDRFFRKGLPCDKAVMASLENRDGMFGSSVFLANYLVNKHIDKRASVRDHFFKWHNPLRPKVAVHNLFFYRHPRFPGFYNHHLPQGYLKQTYQAVWSHCEKDIRRTSLSKFRSYGDIAPWLLRFWQLASGDFTPYDVDKDGKCLYLEDDSIPGTADFIVHQRKKMICLNDSENIRHYEKDKELLLEAFNTLLPERCGFEL